MKYHTTQRLLICIKFIFLFCINSYSQTIVYVPGNISTSPNYPTVDLALTNASNDLRIILTAPVNSPSNGFIFPAGQPGRTVEFYGQDTLTAVIDGSGLSGFSSMFGDGSSAAVYNMNDRLGSLKFTNVKVVNAHTSGNGSILNTNSPISITAVNSVFDNNRADVDGGMFYIRHDTNVPNPIVFRHSKLRNNSAARGGLAYLQNRGVSVGVEFDNCDINNNSARGTMMDESYGGGLVSIFPLTSAFGSYVTINNCSIKDNKSLSDGGLFYFTNQVDGAAVNTIRIAHSTISRNTATNNGGAFYYGRGYYDALIQSSTFDSNRSANGNGAVFYIHRLTGMNSSFVIDQSTFTRNVAHHNGSVLYTGEMNDGSVFNIRNNSVFRFNSATQGSGGVFNIGSVGKNITFHWTDITASNNTAGEDGGVLFNAGSGTNFTFLNVNGEFENNVAGADEILDIDTPVYKGSGGVLYVGLIGENANFNWSNLKFRSNEARTGGGGVFYTDETGRGWKFSMTNLNVVNNWSGRHGGALNLGEGIGTLSNFTIKSSIFENNESRSEYGGGAIIAARMLAGGGTHFDLQDLVFKRNRALQRGGAICLGGYENTQNFSCTMARVDFFDNTSGIDGGAIHFTNAQIEIAEGMFVGNRVISTTTTGLGGAIAFDYTDVTLRNNTFIGNFADTGGAVAHQRSRRASTQNTVFVDNKSSISGIGGATYHSLNSYSTSYYNCLFAGNTAGLFAGAIYQRAYGGQQTEPVPVVNCTFYNNSTTNNVDLQSGISAGALFSHTSSDLANCVFFNNTSPAVSRFNDVNFWVPATSSITTCSMQLANLPAYNNPGSVGVNLFGNVDPDFVNASEILGLSGTGRASDAGLHLRNTLMVDQGTDVVNLTAFDLSGGARIKNRIDMGAYERVVALPVALVNFGVSKEGKIIHFSWTTTFEENSSHFEIEHSTNAVVWNTIGKVSASKSYIGRTDYNFKSEKTEETSRIDYYRLKMIDGDGSFAYSSIRSLQSFEKPEISFHPNPVARTFTIGSLDMSSVLNLEIINLSGITVHRSLPPYKSNSVDVNHLNSGMYVVRMTQENGLVITGRILIVK